MGAYQAVKDTGKQVVGVSNATDFLRSHRSGHLRVVGEPVHQGRSYQLWQVEIRTDDHAAKLIARRQARLQNVEPRS